MSDDIRTGSPADDLDLETIGDLVYWLECAEEDCRRLAVRVRECGDQQYLAGRAHAFGLAAGLLRDVQYKIRLLDEVE